MSPSVRLLALSLVLLAGCGAAGASANLSLRRVVLHQNGIGYFEHEGHVEGDRLALRFGAHEVDDVLSTLTVIDRDPQAHTVVSADVPQRAQPLEGQTEDTADVTLGVRFPDARARDLLVTYAVPTPTWAAAYRIVLPDAPGEGEALLQAWALVHNSSAVDWDGISLVLATSAPLSFAVDLRTPHFVERPDATGRMVAPVATGIVGAERSRSPGDRDGDGVRDADDLCPSDGEDRDGMEDTDGCPDEDNDRDRILDRVDQCPNDPEVYNGTDDEDGCPDRGRVIVEESQIRILEKIYFTRDSSEILPRSAPIVDALAATLNGNPQITRVELQGHASDEEADGWALSAARAGALRAALVTRGVAADRLVVRPFGATRPIDPTHTERGRERNRRAELQILSTTYDERPTTSASTGVTVASASRSADPTVRTTTDGVDARYEVGARVSIPAGSSTLVTIASARVPGEEVYLFRPDSAAPGSESHPFRAARITNHIGLSLVPGTVALFARGAFVGQGLLTALAPDEAATIPYALDESTAVVVEREQSSEPSRLLAIARGVMTLEDRAVVRTRYLIEPGARAPRRIFVRHPRLASYTPRELPPGTERQASAYLVPVPLDAGRDAVLVIDETTPVRRSVAIVSDLRSVITPYLEAAGLSEDVNVKVRAALEKRRILAALEEEIAALRERLTDAAMRAAELRENLHALDAARSSSSAATRRALADRVRAASTDTEALSAELAQKGAAAASARSELSELISALTIEEAAPAPHR